MEFQRIHTLEKVEEVKVVSLLSACSSRKLSHGKQKHRSNLAPSTTHILVHIHRQRSECLWFLYSRVFIK